MTRYVAFILALLVLSPAPAFAGYAEGKEAFINGDWSRALSELRQAADAGDDRAMYLLGNMYRDGSGVTQNFKQAMALYKRAVTEKNNTDAMVAVGLLWDSKACVSSDTKNALKWFLRAAQMGNGTGAYLVGVILSGSSLEPAKDIQRDYYSAYKWFRIAAAGDAEHSNYRGAAENMALVTAKSKMSAEDVAKADKEVKIWKPVALASGEASLPFPDVFESLPSTGLNKKIK